MKYILLILLLVSTVASFGQTKLIAKLIRNSPTDTTYGLLNDSLIIGGHMTLSSIANRDAIPFSNRTRGMFAVVNDTVFILKGGISNASWQIFTVDTSKLVPKSRTISINGVTKSLDSNITFTTRSANGTITYAGVYLTKPNDSTVAADTTALGTLFRLKRDKINSDSLNGQLPAYYLNRTNQTGTQSISTVTGLSGNAPISYSSGVISSDTGRGTAQLATGYDLKKVRDSVQANIPTNYLTNNTAETVTAEKTFSKNKLAIYNPTLGTQLFINATDDATASTINFPNSSNDTVAYRSWTRQNSGGGGGGTVARFDHDVIVNGTTLGAFGNGETIPLNGRRVDSLPDILAKKCSHPSYVTPTAAVSASPAATSYEYGTNIGAITISSTSGSNAGNSGGFTTDIYYQNGTALGGSTATISSLTTTQSFYVNKSYSTGAVLNDNCGVPDPFGRITASSVNSNPINFTPFFLRYWGWVNTSTPSDATVRGLTQDAGGLSLTVTNTTPTGSQYFVYYHSTSSGSITSVVVNGFPSTSAFTISTLTFTNAQGVSSSYQKIVSNNALLATTTFVFN